MSSIVPISVLTPTADATTPTVYTPSPTTATPPTVYPTPPSPSPITATPPTVYPTPPWPSPIASTSIYPPFPDPLSPAALRPANIPASSPLASAPSSSSSTAIGIGIGVAVLVAAAIGIIGVAVLVALAVIAAVCVFMWRKRKRRMASLEEGHLSKVHSQAAIPAAAAPPPSNTDVCEEAAQILPPAAGGLARFSPNPGDDLHVSPLFLGPRSFSYEELSIATKRFSNSELLGEGGFGLVYRGTLPNDGKLVAVKCIAQNSSQGEKEFKAEVTIIGALRHRNLVRLRGWCHAADEGKLFLLVYDYMPNGSLDHLLFNNLLCSKLSWEKRYAIASGIGSALLYLHEECDNVIIHRDVKTSNVLLDENFNAKLGDFGLAREVDQGMTSHTTMVGGTRGYMAPECFLGNYGRATRETDVYAFGAVLLELVCGKRAIDASLEQHEGMLVDWVWHLYSQDKVMEAVDERLMGQYDNEEARRMLHVGLLCSHPDSKARPKIMRALEVLLGTVALPFLPSSKPSITFGTPPPISISKITRDSSQGEIATTNSTNNSSNPHSTTIPTNSSSNPQYFSSNPHSSTSISQYFSSNPHSSTSIDSFPHVP